jgi:hypothetical protein
MPVPYNLSKINLIFQNVTYQLGLEPSTASCFVFLFIQVAGGMLNLVENQEAG